MKIKLLLLSLVLCFVCTGHEQLVDKSTDSKDFKLSYQSINLIKWPDVIASYQGDVLVIDMWATWCSSCIQRFPHMVTMNRLYQNKGVCQVFHHYFGMLIRQCKTYTFTIHPTL